jgi:predicted DNA binding CopG/RHH family protein
MPNVRIEKAKKAKALGVSLPPELILQAKKHAFSQGMSFSKFVRSLLARELMEIQKK